VLTPIDFDDNLTLLAISVSNTFFCSLYHVHDKRELIKNKKEIGILYFIILVYFRDNIDTSTIPELAFCL